MRCAVSQLAAVIVAAAVSQLHAGEARAREATAGSETILLFSGLDVWRHGAFSYAGVAWSPKGNDQEGFVLKLSSGAGSYRYHSDDLAIDVKGRILSFSLLPGWRFQHDHLSITAFAGIDYQRHDLTPVDVTSKLLGPYTGIRGALEIWYEPDDTMMVAGDLSATSIGPSYSGRAAVGWRMFDRFYFGPEVAAFAFDGNYRQYRVGAHVTALKIGAIEWSASAGWSRDTDNRDGFYGRLNLLKRSGLPW
jgi:hypothetical protein